jgi:hypothetical protein
MAYFAQLDRHNIVAQVIAVSNVDAPDPFPASEAAGQAFIASLGLDGMWLQTSYNGRIRKNYAGIGYTYDPARDAFIPPKPYPSWLLNETTCLWDAPVSYPTDGQDYDWNEDDQTWQSRPQPSTT